METCMVNLSFEHDKNVVAFLRSERTAILWQIALRPVRFFYSLLRLATSTVRSVALIPFGHVHACL